jgi:hypothetical protein
VGTNGCLQGHWQPASASPAKPCRQLRGMPGAARQILAMAVKAQVTAAPTSCPRPGGPGVGSRAIVRCRARYRIPPGPGRGHQPGHGACTSGGCGWRQARAARHLAGVPGRRLMPAAQSAKSAGTPPGDDDLDAAAAHPGQGGSRQPALPAGQQPSRGALATGHVGPRRAPTGARARAATGQAAPPAQTVVSAQDCLRQVG